VGPREGWEGYEPLVENIGDIGKRTIALGFNIPEWRKLDFYESRSIGRLPRDHGNWDPAKWAAHIPNAAFRHLRPDDTFWAAYKLTTITDDMIKAAVAEGQFGDPPAEEFLAKAIGQRRARILQTYLPAVNPIVNPSLGASGLTFANAAVEAGVAAAPKSYHAVWSTFDNNTGQTAEIGITEGAVSPLAVPTMPAGGFVRVEMSAAGGPAAWTTPITVYFRKKGAEWSLVGLERLPERWTGPEPSKSR
jgi:hypothetical protein